MPMGTAISVQRFARRPARGAGLLLVGLLCGAASAAGGPGSAPAPAPTEGAVVGRLGLDAPPLDSFIVHGTMPVPSGVHPRADGLSPFQLRDDLGVLSPAQVEIVSRYPNQAGVQAQADVVELIARVARPPGAAAGDPIAYDVVFAPHAPTEFQASPGVADLLARPRNLRLRTSDVFGNGYRAEPLRNLSSGWSRRVLKSGELVLQETTHQSLKPTFHEQGPGGTLPHSMGVHTYLTQWADEEFVSLDLRVHNQHCGRLPEDPNDDALGGVYFRSLGLRLPEGGPRVSASPDPFFGAAYDAGD
jgi:hypothetical protein